jgi:hypothetical protein
MIFKVNTVVTSKNKLEDMSSLINEVKPVPVASFGRREYGEGAGKLH